MVKIKQKLVDFRVKELLNLEVNNGRYAYFILKKKGYNTLDAIEILAKKLRINLKNFGFAGNKDKFAETEQYLSILNCNKNKIENLNLEDLKLEFVGYGKKRINLGDNTGNEFEIKVYDYNKYYGDNFFINYFGEQRFGKENWIIGKRILKKEKINLDAKRKRFCISSYQGYLWNKAVKILLRRSYLKNIFEVGDYIFLNRKIRNIKVPLINFDTNLNNKIGKIYLELMKNEGIKKDDFIFRDDPRLTTETVYRNLIVKVDKVSFKSDILRFRLPKGSYATVFIRGLFREDIEYV